MADNITVTPGAGATVATDERTINSSSVQVQRVSSIGGTSLNSGQTAVTNSATLIASAADTRESILLVNHQSVDVWVGGSSVSTTTGVRIPVEGSLTIPATAAVYGITASAYTASGDAKVHWVEVTAP